MSGFQIPFTGLERQYNNLREEILAATDRVLSSGQLMDGVYTTEFEAWLANQNHSQYALTCHSGTQALELIAGFYATEYEMGKKPTVGIPTLTYPATANAFLRSGWNVEFFDVDVNGILDLTKIDPDCGIDILILIGLYGASVYNTDYIELQLKFLLQDFVVIEDAAQHWLSNYCRRIGHAAAISFDPMKNLASYGNGGAIVTNDEILYQTVRAMRNNGKPSHDIAGTNSRMSELDCAHMLVKTKHLDSWQQRRRDIAQYYREHFRNLPVRCLINSQNINSHCFHKFVIDTDQQQELKRYLTDHGIETRIHYTRPCHELPIFFDCKGPNLINVASSLSRRVLSLPIYPELSDSEVDVIVGRVRAFFS